MKHLLNSLTYLFLMECAIFYYHQPLIFSVTQVCRYFYLFQLRDYLIGSIFIEFEDRQLNPAILLFYFCLNRLIWLMLILQYYQEFCWYYCYRNLFFQEILNPISRWEALEFYCIATPNPIILTIARRINSTFIIGYCEAEEKLNFLIAQHSQVNFSICS